MLKRLHRTYTCQPPSTRTRNNKNCCSWRGYLAAPRRGQPVARRLVLQCIHRFFHFYPFAHKIPIVNPFLPTRSIHLNQSHSIKKSSFQPSQNNFPKSLIITYFSKITKVNFHTKPKFLPKIFHNQILWFKTEVHST